MSAGGGNARGSLITRRATAYLPAVDGLRAIAIAAVFVYHAHSGWLPGGFLGVDLFFAISGFLITRGLLREHDERGRVDLRQFWLRRARRLLPAALVFVFLLIAAAQAFFPGDLRALRGVALAAVGYVANWYLVFSNQPYFETVGRPQLLQHLWSLAVEEQFYLIWPPLLLLALRLARRRAVFAGTVLLGVASAVWMAVMYRDGAEASRLYYGTDTHAVGLLFGAALAFIEPAWRARDGHRFAATVQAAGVSALLAIAFLFAWLAESRAFLYQGGFVLTAVVSAVLIVAATMPGRVAVVLGSGPFRWLGVRSYSVYLWHPPLVALLLGTGPALPQPVLVGLAAAATLLVAHLSFRYVETPIRTGAALRALDEFRQLRRDTQWAVGGAAAAAVAAVVTGAAFARPLTPPTYLTVLQLSGVLVATAPAEATTVAPSWVVPRDAGAAGGSPAEPVSRTIPVRTPTAGLTVSSMSAIVPDMPSSSVQSAAPVAAVTGILSASSASTPLPLTASVFALGESVMLGAAQGLAGAFGTIELDAAIGRDAASALRILRERRAAHRLPATVIVQIGNNGLMTRPQIDEMMQILADVPRVVIVDLHVPQPWEAPNNAMLAGIVSRHPNARLAEWHAASESRGDLFWDDIHLRPDGIALYVALIAAKAGITAKVE